MFKLTKKVKKEKLYLKCYVNCAKNHLTKRTTRKYFQNSPLHFLNGPGHAKMCLMAYAKNKGADQPARCAVCSAPLLFAA